MATRDNLTLAALHGTAWRRATERGSIENAAAELWEIAGGRRDLLAQTAGNTVGGWLVSPATHIGTELLLSGLCIYAGADLNLIEQSVRLGHERALKGRQQAQGDDFWRATSRRTTDA